MGKGLLLAGIGAPAGGVLRVAQGTSFLPKTGSVGGAGSNVAGAVTGVAVGVATGALGLLTGIGRACVAVGMDSCGGRSSGEGIPENAATVGAKVFCGRDWADVSGPGATGLSATGASAASVVSLSDE
jgi:hypothetical protein